MDRTETYCKAYPVEKLRNYPQWLSSIKGDDTGCGFLSLHESLVVTKDIFPDQQIIFNAITDEWRQFCRESLQFAVPRDLIESPTPVA